MISAKEIAVVVLFAGGCSGSDADGIIEKIVYVNECDSGTEQIGSPTGVPCANDIPCVDADLCNGTERCEGGQCWTGVPVDIDDDLYCTIDLCNQGNVEHHPRKVDDGDPCTEDYCTEENQGEIRHDTFLGAPGCMP